MSLQSAKSERGAMSALWMSTIAFTACFAVWTIFSIIGVRIRHSLGLSQTEFGLLAGTPILTGSLTRLFLGVWAERIGGRRVLLAVMLLGAIATFLLSYAQTYPQFLLAALGVGLAGGSFSVGVAYISKFYPANRQGTALGIFGAGNIGATVTILAAPFVMTAFGWEVVARLWATALAILGFVFYFSTRDEPDIATRRAAHVRPPSLLQQFAPLSTLRVWRFSLYYFFTFGGFVGLTLWLPSYLVDVYLLDIKTAGMIAVAFSAPAGLFRIYGGHLADKIGARLVMYWTFGVAVIATFLLSYPPTSYIVEGIRGPIAFRLATALPAFALILLVLGFFMSLGSAAVFKHIPTYYPKNVGAVGGLVGAIGGLGGFVLPIAFGAMNDIVGVRTSCFMLLFVLVAIAFVWMHVTILLMEREAFPKLKGPKDLPELGGALGAKTADAAGAAPAAPAAAPVVAAFPSVKP